MLEARKVSFDPGESPEEILSKIKEEARNIKDELLSELTEKQIAKGLKK